MMFLNNPILLEILREGNFFSITKNILFNTLKLFIFFGLIDMGIGNLLLYFNAKKKEQI